MKRSLTTFFLQIVLLSICFGQYDKYNLVLSGGINYATYLGSGEGENVFQTRNPGFQFELTFSDDIGMEWIFWGIKHYKTENVVAGNRVPVEFWIPYYTEFSFFQKAKKNPFFWFFGYDYARMRFPSMEKPDSHHNITFGGGSNLRIVDRLYLQLKIKPYFVIGNSIGQWFGITGMLNLHLGLRE